MNYHDHVKDVYIPNFEEFVKAADALAKASNKALEDDNCRRFHCPNDTLSGYKPCTHDVDKSMPLLLNALAAYEKARGLSRCSDCGTIWCVVHGNCNRTPSRSRGKL